MEDFEVSELFYICPIFIIVSIFISVVVSIFSELREFEVFLWLVESFIVSAGNRGKEKNGGLIIEEVESEILLILDD